MVLTASKAEPDIQRAYDLGANSYLIKPGTFQDLVGLVKDNQDLLAGTQCQAALRRGLRLRARPIRLEKGGQSFQSVLLMKKRLQRETKKLKKNVVRPVDDYHWNTLSMARTRDLFCRHASAAQVTHIGTFLRWCFHCPEIYNDGAYTFVIRI